MSFELLDSQADALVLLVDVDDHRFHLVALLEQLAGVIDLARPRHVGDVDHAIDAFLELNKRAVGGHVAHDSLDLFADLIAVLDLVPWVRFELADAEADLLLFLVDAEHDCFDFLANGEHVAGTGDPLGPGEFGNVNESFDPFLDLHERAVRNEVGDFAFDLGADRETVLGLVPGIFLGLLEAEGDALLFLVDIEHDHFDLLTDLEQFARVAKAAPGHIGDVKEAVHSIEVDESAEVGEILDRTNHVGADLDVFEEALAFLGALLLDDFAAAEHHVFAVVVYLDDFEIVRVADKLLKIAGRNDVDLGAGEESFDADVDGEPAFDHGFDFAFDEAVALEDFDDFLPVLFIGGLLFGENDHAFVIFEAAQKHFDFVANLEIIDVVKFARGDDTFALVANVDEHFAVADLKDTAFDDAAFFKIAHRLRDQVLHFNHGLCVSALRFRLIFLFRETS